MRWLLLYFNDRQESPDRKGLVELDTPLNQPAAGRRGQIDGHLSGQNFQHAVTMVVPRSRSGNRNSIRG